MDSSGYASLNLDYATIAKQQTWTKKGRFLLLNFHSVDIIIF